MMSGILRVPSKELSRDDFLETYGPITPRKPSSSASDELYKKDCSNFETKFATARKMSSHKHKNACNENSLNNNNEMNEGSHVCAQADEIDGNQPKPTIERYKPRNSIHNIASRIARKSINMVTRRNSLIVEVGSNGNTPSKWNTRLFKRSSSTTPPCDANPASPSLLVATTSAPEKVIPRDQSPRILSRSSSHLPITSSPNKKSTESPKRYSIKYPSQWKKDRTKSDMSGLTYSKSRCSNKSGYQSPELTSRSSKPKTELSSKYEEIRKQEEARNIAIVTLLRRRKNSLKLKCSQFEKELDTIKENEMDAFKSKLNRMRRKLNVVNQCLSEEREALKVTNAKLELKQKLDQFNFEMSKDLSALLQSSSMSPSTSCDTLPSVDGTSVFDPSSPALSTVSLDHTTLGDTRVYRKECLRQASAPVTPSSPYPNFKSYLTRKQAKAGRSMSIDCAMTSDCDSGFDNGDSMSRSNVSLDQDLTKSSQSLLAECREENSKFSDDKRSHSTNSAFSYQSSLDNKNSWKKNCTKEDDNVGKEVLDQIREFEVFAEKTLRRISKKGKLVPLKKYS